MPPTPDQPDTTDQPVQGTGAPPTGYRSTAAAIGGVILIVLGMIGLLLGIDLTGASGFMASGFSGLGHFFVALSILMIASGVALVRYGTRPARPTTTSDQTSTGSDNPPP
jgi:hypothetical protein